MPYLMQPPDRLTVPTCVGCGAMGRFGTCEAGCREEKLELVRAAAHDSISHLGITARQTAEAFLDVTEQLVLETPGDREAPAAYHALQQKARAVLGQHPDKHEHVSDVSELSEAATTWWCPECGGIDAPQPCLGICVWRSVEWVKRSLYESERQQALADHARARALRELMRRIAYVTPRPGQWQRNWQALQAQAEALGLAVCREAPKDG